MKTSRTMRRNNHSVAIIRFAAFAIIFGLMQIAVANSVTAQALPPRGYDTQVSRPLTTPPIPQIDRQVHALQQQIIDATDPKWGTVNVKKLKKPISIIPGPFDPPVAPGKPGKPRSLIPMD